MSLAPGTKLEFYEIVAPIGAGGMGEVYRARDTRLGRDVAIKVLPSAVAQDRERLARFEREARVLASLNHPYIAQIYGLAESGDTRALVMELVEGSTLSVPQPIDTALNYARQIAEALEAAHERGITHRDLKPANIMITPDGQVKVLDFGLASVPNRDREGSDPTNSPTMTMAATQAGFIMGTAAYMSPEQAAGKPVDKRADIWSFGVVLWEMLSGERLFAGETVSHTLADVLRAPINFNKLPKETPRAVRELVKRCLDRDVKSRLRDIGEARIALQNVGKESEVSATAAAPTSRFGWVAWGVAGLFLLTALALALVHFREAPPEARAVNTTLLPPAGAEFDFSNPFAPPALSPDGTRIVFGAKPKDGKTQLWLRRLDSPGAQPLPGTERAAFPFWSPDSRWVAFGQDRKLKKIDIQGGPPVPITDVQGAFRGGSWSPKGVIVFGANATGSSAHGIFRVAAAGGTASLTTTLEPGKESRNHVFPWFLPDGRHFLYTRQQEGDLPVRVGSLDEPSKPGKVVAQANSAVAYAQGHLLYLRENTLMAQPFDPDRLETTGEAVPLAERVPTFLQPSRRGAFTVSAKGLMVYQAFPAEFRATIVWKDRQGKTLGNLGESTGSIADLAFSPDGKRLAASILDRASSSDIWIYDTARGIPTRFTFDPALDQEPIWSPDGRTLYFRSNRRGQPDIFRKDSNGASAEELLLGDPVPEFPTSVSADGRLLLYSRQDEKTGYDLWVLPLTQTQPGGKPEPRVFLRTPFNEAAGQFSPDGRWVAYQSNESGQTEVYVAAFPGPGSKHQVSSAGGQAPRWRRDGKEIFYMAPDGQLMAAEVTAGNETLEVGQTQKLFEHIGAYDVSADGKKFVVVEGGTGEPAPLTLLQNWPMTLRK